MYNAEGTILACISSVINQTYQGEFEIIIVNDGSSDNSRKIVEEIIRDSPSNVFVRLINKENGGVSSARNKGLALARGEFIALLDSDDEWLANKIESQLNVFKDNNEVFFIGGLISEPKPKGDLLIHITLSKLIFKNYFQPSTVMFRREVFEKIGYFDERQKFAEEGNYFIRVAAVFTTFLLNKQLVYYGQGKRGFGVSGLSSNLIEMEKGELRNIKFAYQKNYISLFTYLIAVTFSIFKYIRRLLLVKFK